MTSTTPDSGGAMPSLTADEQSYFDNRGEPPASAPKPEPDNEPEAEAELVEADSDEGDAPERAEPDDSESEPKKAPPKLVNLKALHEERDRRKASEERARALEIEYARMSERLAMLTRQTAPKQEEVAAPPNPDDDIFGAVKHTASEIEATKRQIAEFQRQQQAQEQQRHLASYVDGNEREFVKEKPDYYQAVSYIREARAKELRAMGYDDAAITRTITNDSLGIAQMAAQRRLNPAQVVYEIAASRGYRPPAPKVAAAEAADDAPRPSTKSLSQAGGAPAGGGVTAADVLRMSSSEYDKFASKNPDKLRRLMGG